MNKEDLDLLINDANWLEYTAPKANISHTALVGTASRIKNAVKFIETLKNIIYNIGKDFEYVGPLTIVTCRICNDYIETTGGPPYSIKHYKDCPLHGFEPGERDG